MRSGHTFHQAIFGYDSGHHLLAASLSLSTDQRHFLAVATDLSGSAPASGFEFMYTGMPLPGTRYYAFFCTWLAPEMPRPGSVWSHVLFIEFDDLAAIEDLGVLRLAFRRPSAGDFKNYATPVQLNAQHAERTKLASELFPISGVTLQDLYANRNTPVILLAPDKSGIDDLVFLLWTQQWPRLRQSFRFSTGSFADRGRGDSSFDLQVSPPENRRVWQRQGEYSLIDTRSPHLLTNPEPWIRAATEDLVSPNRGGLRTFFGAVGSDIHNPRSAFAKLVIIYERMQSSLTAEWVDVLEAVGQFFPEKDDALSLKEAVCNPIESNDQYGMRSLSIATFLLSSNAAKPFESVSLDLTRLSRRLWKIKRRDVLELLARLVRQPEKDSASRFARSIAESVRPDDLELISIEWPELLSLILGHNSDLASQEDLWRMPALTQRKAYEALEGLRIEPEKWAEIISSMKPNSTAISARSIIRNAGSFAMDGAFHWVERDEAEDWMPSEEWREALAMPAAETLISGTPLSPIRVAFSAWLLAPQIAPQLLSASREDIQQLANESVDILPTWLRSHTSFLLVTLGLRSKDILGVKCLVRGFFSVYDSLAFGNYSSESWILLYPELPNLGFWSEWDRCKKLRYAIRNFPPINSVHVAELLVEAATTPVQRHLAEQLRPD